MTKMNNMNNGMMVVCGDSIEELEQGLAMMEMVMKSGKVMGVGGSSLEDVKQGMEALSKVLGCSAPVVPSAPITRGKDEWVPVYEDEDEWDDEDEDEWDDDDDDDDEEEWEEVPASTEKVVQTVEELAGVLRDNEHAGTVGADMVRRMIEAYERSLNNN